MQLNGQIVVFSITIFNDVLGMLIMVLTGGENMELSEIIEMLQQEYPEKIVVDLTEYENEDHQTYKFLYEQLDVTHTQKMNEFGLVISDMQQFTKENAELEEQNRTLKEQLDKMNSSVWQLLDQFKNQVNREIVVSDVKTSRKFDQKIDAKSFMQTISTTPGIYGGKRPSWYTPLKRQLSRENMKQKNVSNTIGTLKNKLLFWKNMKTQSPDKAATEYDNKRRDNILKLLQEECSNEEKYLKYFLLTPGLDREYLKTLQGAAQINVDANLVIALLEQPNDSYNREIIELYVSEIHKGTEYDLKQELAEELIRGEWCINAKVEGKETVWMEFFGSTVSLCVKIEEELASLDEDEEKEMLEALGLEESGLDKVIKASYDLLGLMSFLTAGEPEVRAWTIKKGTKAPQAAGKIHSDIERGFIRAEIVSYDDLIREGSINAVKERGLMRSEGKEYVMQDGDVVLFRFNV